MPSAGVAPTIGPGERMGTGDGPVDNRLRLTYGCVEVRQGLSLAWVLEREPAEVAAEVADAAMENPAWLAEFIRALERRRRRRGSELGRILATWGLSQAEAAHIFGISRQAVSKWVETGVPPERSRAVADLAAATDLLEHYLKAERIPAVVRRQAQSLDGMSLLQLATAGDTRAALRATREMFDFAAVES